MATVILHLHARKSGKMMQNDVFCESLNQLRNITFLVLYVELFLTNENEENAVLENNGGQFCRSCESFILCCISYLHSRWLLAIKK